MTRRFFFFFFFFGGGDVTPSVFQFLYFNIFFVLLFTSSDLFYLSLFSLVVLPSFNPSCECHDVTATNHSKIASRNKVFQEFLGTSHENVCLPEETRYESNTIVAVLSSGTSTSISLEGI